MSLFDLDIDELITQTLPPQLLEQNNIDFHKILSKPTKDLFDTFKAFRDKTLKEMRYNGQTVILENLLNDIFDPNNRGIRIYTSSDVLQPVYIGTPQENEPLYLGTKAEQEPVYLGTPGEYVTNYDFVVEVPVGILTSEQENRIKAITQKYKLAGKFPRYIYQNGTIF
jgi:hypothetical protein